MVIEALLHSALVAWFKMALLCMVGGTVYHAEHEEVYT